jgi:hypothetical protein
MKEQIKKILRLTGSHLLTLSDSAKSEYSTAPELLNQFLEDCRKLDSPKTLELGTKRSIPERSTKHFDWVPHSSQFLGVDISEGMDVDIVADVHSLSNVVGCDSFDIIISSSTFEHFKYPHLAAHELMKVLKVGGLLFIQTHQTFPLHAYPFDYFRFSKEALAGLFGRKMGFQVIGIDYQYLSRISSYQIPDAYKYPSYLNVLLFGKKVATTPEHYIYEFDT